MRESRRIADIYLRQLSDDISDLKRRAEFLKQSYLDVAGLKGRSFDAIRSGGKSDPVGNAVLGVESLSESLTFVYDSIQKKQQMFDSLISACSRDEKDVMYDYYISNLRVKDIQLRRALSEITVKKRISAGRDAAISVLCRKNREMQDLKRGTEQ